MNLIKKEIEKGTLLKIGLLAVIGLSIVLIGMNQLYNIGRLERENIDLNLTIKSQKYVDFGIIKAYNDYICEEKANVTDGRIEQLEVMPVNNPLLEDADSINGKDTRMKWALVCRNEVGDPKLVLLFGFPP